MAQLNGGKSVGIECQNSSEDCGGAGPTALIFGVFSQF